MHTDILYMHKLYIYDYTFDFFISTYDNRELLTDLAHQRQTTLAP
jgi:hypothetical protein